MSPAKESDEQYSEAETIRRREATLKRMLSTPHTPQKPLGNKRRKAKVKTASKKR